MSETADYQPFDMLGDPVPADFKGTRGRGAPPHVATPDRRKIVIGLWAMGKDNEYCAAALGISEPTFRKHYFRSAGDKRVKDHARARLDGMMLAATIAEIEKGSMAAVKQLRDLTHRADMERLAKDIARGRSSEKAPKEEKLGKKDELARAAAAIEGVFAPPKGSGAVN